MGEVKEFCGGVDEGEAEGDEGIGEPAIIALIRSWLNI